MDELISELLEELKIELDVSEESDIAKLEIKLKNAIREVKLARGYLATHDADFIDSDLMNYISNIKRLTIYDFNQIGAEGQVSMNEIGTSRTWFDRCKCFEGIVKFSKLV